MTTKQSLKKKLEDEEAAVKLNGKNDIEDGYEYKTVPPDGGFGWVIAFAAMLCNLVCDGTLFAFGTMKIHLQKHFECSDMLILMVGSVPCGVYLLVGPIVSGLANRYGCRIIIIIGSIGAAICMVLSTWSPNVWAMMIIYGVFGGIFFGMVYLPSVVMVSFYFDKKRAIANGLVTAGTGIGALSFGPLADFLMGQLGWQWGIRIFAALMLLCVLFGAIMKPLQPIKVPIEPEVELNNISKPNETGKRQSSSSISQNLPDQEAGPLFLPVSGGESARFSFPATVPNGDAPSNDNATLSTDNATLSPLKNTSRIRTTSSSSQSSSVFGSGQHHRAGVSNPEDAARPLYKKDALYTGSIPQLHKSQTSLHKSNPYLASATNIPAAVNEETKKESAYLAFLNILSEMTNFSILRNKSMLLICIGNIFSMLGYYLPIMCLVSFAVDDLKVNQSTASFLLTIFGIFNTIGRFAGGPISMIRPLNPLIVHNALLFVAGIVTVLAAYSFNFFTCALYAGVCGFAIAPHMSLLPSVICDCVGLDRFTTAFGILFLFRGVTSIIGPPAAGFIKDYTAKYDIAFAIGGAMIIIAAFFHICIACVQREKESENEDDGKEEFQGKNKIDV